MSMYQSASRPEESVTFPCTTARSTMSWSRRSRSGRAVGSMDSTLEKPRGRCPTRRSVSGPGADGSGGGGGGQHLVDDVDGGVGRLHVAADHRGLHLGEGAVHGDG